VKVGDLVRIRKEHEQAYDPTDDRLGKVGLVTADLKPGHMAWVIWPPRPYEATMDYPDDLEIISEAG
jgi:hypothetical protein